MYSLLLLGWEVSKLSLSGVIFLEFLTQIDDTIRDLLHPIVYTLVMIYCKLKLLLGKGTLCLLFKWLTVEMVNIDQLFGDISHLWSLALDLNLILFKHPWGVLIEDTSDYTLSLLIHDLVLAAFLSSSVKHEKGESLHCIEDLNLVLSVSECIWVRSATTPTTFNDVVFQFEHRNEMLFLFHTEIPLRFEVLCFSS